MSAYLDGTDVLGAVITQRGDAKSVNVKLQVKAPSKPLVAAPGVGAPRSALTARTAQPAAQPSSAAPTTSSALALPANTPSATQISTALAKATQQANAAIAAGTKALKAAKTSQQKAAANAAITAGNTALAKIKKATATSQTFAAALGATTAAIHGELIGAPRGNAPGKMIQLNQAAVAAAQAMIADLQAASAAGDAAAAATLTAWGQTAQASTLPALLTQIQTLAGQVQSLLTSLQSSAVATTTAAPVIVSLTTDNNHSSGLITAIQNAINAGTPYPTPAAQAWITEATNDLAAGNAIASQNGLPVSTPTPGQTTITGTAAQQLTQVQSLLQQAQFAQMQLSNALSAGSGASYQAQQLANQLSTDVTTGTGLVSQLSALGASAVPAVLATQIQAWNTQIQNDTQSANMQVQQAQMMAQQGQYGGGGGGGGGGDDGGGDDGGAGSAGGDNGDPGTYGQGDGSVDPGAGTYGQSTGDDGSIPVVQDDGEHDPYANSQGDGWGRGALDQAAAELSTAYGDGSTDDGSTDDGAPDTDDTGAADDTSSDGDPSEDMMGHSNRMYLFGTDILGADTIPSAGVTYTDKPTVLAVQKALLTKGFKLPKYGADGNFGDETATAIRAMQSAAGIPQTGVIDSGVLVALGVSAPILTYGPPLPVAPPASTSRMTPGEVRPGPVINTSSGQPFAPPTWASTPLWAGAPVNRLQGVIGSVALFFAGTGITLALVGRSKVQS